jgi:hypothetical protein
MKSRYLPLAGLLLIGTFGASDLTGTTTNTDSISSATIANIKRIADTTEILLSSNIGIIADDLAIEKTQMANASDRIIQIAKINGISSMAIRSIIDDEIRDNHIDNKIIEIDA